MKRIITLISLLLIANFIGYSQVPEKLNYQAVIRNNNGDLITNQNVNVSISIIDNNPDGTLLYREIHNETTSKYGIINVVVGGGAPELGSFSQIDWSDNIKFLNVSVDVGDGYVNMGTTQLLTVPYAFYSKQADSSRVAELAYNANSLGSNGVYSTSTDTLFVVKDHSGNVVFAVFPDGAQVIVNESTKGKVGGFAVSGRNPSKAVDYDIMKVTTDSTRIYVNDTLGAKGRVGGFAVSGRNPSKGNLYDYLQVTKDSTRVYVNNSVVKGRVGGFAVSGRNPSKGTSEHMFVTTVDSTRVFTKDTVGGFAVQDNSTGSNSSYMRLTPLNYFIGHESGELVKQNPTYPDRGKYNTFFGYNAGKKNTYGYNNIFMGYRAGYSNDDGNDNIFLGISAGFSNVNSSDNIFIGNYAGYNTEADDPTFGSENVFIGSNAGYSNLEGYDNVYIGAQSGEDNLNGRGNVFIGGFAGNSNLSRDNTIVGGAALYKNTSGMNNTVLGAYAGTNNLSGTGNVFIGYQAGYNETGSNRLYIDNSSTSSPLIYGEFDNNRLSFNGNVGVNRAAYGSVSLAISPNSQNYGLYVDAGRAVYAGYFIGSVYATGTFSTSDIRFKRDVEPIIDPIDKIKGIRGVSYYWDTEKFKERGFSNEKQIGVIAQEVEKVLPELVHEDESGYKSVSYDKLSAVLIEAIKEQQSQIENLESKNKDVEKLRVQIEDLKKENEELKEKLTEIIKLLEQK